ncbi:MAG: hypothetical protein N2044_03080 [Cyclobacteriaceae bacterium]|nr:hypothetical protein [Cyclobacteriaceae bacterium]MCX7636809.1 hypothetical protein [Cyclobacteriaceae bacterium]MDW8331300.1 hypothetical protein [Cyclobacteriaceae bacterium]
MRGFIVILIAAGLVVASLTSVDAGLYIGYILLLIAVIAAIGLPLLNSVKSPGELKKPLLALLLMVALFAVSYALSGSDVTPEQAAKGITESTSKLVGAGLTMFYLISGIAVLGLIYSEVNKALK